MGRSFESVRIGAKEVSARWLKASRALKEESKKRARSTDRTEPFRSGREVLQLLRGPNSAAPSAPVICGSGGT